MKRVFSLLILVLGVSLIPALAQSSGCGSGESSNSSADNCNAGSTTSSGNGDYGGETSNPSLATTQIQCAGACAGVPYIAQVIYWGPYMVSVGTVLNMLGILQYLTE